MWQRLGSFPFHDILDFPPPSRLMDNENQHTTKLKEFLNKNLTNKPQVSLIQNVLRKAESTNFSESLQSRASPSQNVSLDMSSVEGTSHKNSDYILKNSNISTTISNGSSILNCMSIIRRISLPCRAGVRC